MKKILVIDDDVDICLLLSRFLTKNAFSVSTAHSGAKALEILKKETFDLVLCDFRLGDTDGTEILTKIKEINPAIAVIIITGYLDIKIAVKVIKLGAFDYVTKPLFPEEILLTVKKALESLENKNSNEAVRAKLDVTDSDFIFGESSQSKELYRQIDLVAPTSYSVIIYGESGTGKESVAQTIHNKSPRKNKPFIAMDCGSLSKELAGSELFGHEKGSFTGALTSKIGHFELANGGTLFLDEVSNLSYDIQASLLRVLQERKAKRIGGLKEIDLDVRIIVATNENLYDAASKGEFREDLYHRFNEFGINIPSLRERDKDIMAFANHFLKLANKELQKDIKGFSEDVTNSFKNYQWPGNLRELKNVIRRSALLTDEEFVQKKVLPPEIYNFNNSFLEKKQGFMLHQVSSAPNLKNVAHEAEYETITSVLEQVNYNKSKAAKILNIDRKTLYNKMKAFNI
ncbi:MAG: sigma-54-dependent Fis family transcriptional regulator [Bacteroidetes bacterium]|nr:sigma-54-dependent Fis family transcriptional regulator [Bacteroidota bacterium]HET6245666.1 sigma-54 dependent transcriptional regulator [Bacteroidia bacterium]